MEWLKKYWTQLIFIVSFIVALTTTNIQVSQNTKNITKLENKQSSSDIILQDIRVELSAINTKLEMIMANSHLIITDGTK